MNKSPDRKSVSLTLIMNNDKLFRDIKMRSQEEYDGYFYRCRSGIGHAIS